MKTNLFKTRTSLRTEGDQKEKQEGLKVHLGKSIRTRVCEERRGVVHARIPTLKKQLLCEVSGRLEQGRVQK